MTEHVTIIAHPRCQFSGMIFVKTDSNGVTWKFASIQWSFCSTE